MIEETGWVIEAQHTDGFPLYFCGSTVMFSSGHAKAVRFCRSEDAESVRLGLMMANKGYAHGLFAGAKIVEHLWCGDDHATKPPVNLAHRPRVCPDCGGTGACEVCKACQGIGSV